MPLKALIENETIISSFLSEIEWADLSEKIKQYDIPVIICQSNKPGYLRRSKNGVQHFVHYSKPKNWKPESAEHLFLKNEILISCKELGLVAEPEVSGDDWEADVLVNIGNARVAFEVQCSYQTEEKTIERQNKFIRDNIRACWFFKKIPKGFFDSPENKISQESIPFFKITQNTKTEYLVIINNIQVSLKNFIKHLLNKEVKFKKHVSGLLNQLMHINVCEYRCHRCGQEQHNYFLTHNIQGKCGLELKLDYKSSNYDKIRFNVQVLNRIKELRGSKEFIFGSEGTINYENEFNEGGIGCVLCGFAIRDDLEDPLYNLGSLDVLKKIDIHVNLSNYNVEFHHWCFDENKEFC